MPDDPLDIIAASYKTLADTQRTLAQTQHAIVDTQHLIARLTWWAMVPSVLGLLILGWLAWQTVTLRHESAVLQQTVLSNTQTIAAQTQAILERLRQP
jgi:hypothetical protein